MELSPVVTTARPAVLFRRPASCCEASGQLAAGTLGIVAFGRRLRARRTEVSRKAEEEPPRWDPTAPVWTAEDLEDTATGPAAGSTHTHTPLGSDGSTDGQNPRIRHFPQLF
eukprot:s553_g11.t1